MSQSLQRGSLVFDVMPVYETPSGVRVLGMREHTERFLRSAALNAMDLAWDEPALLTAIGETIRANPGCDIVKICACYTGVSLDVLPADAHASVSIAAFAVSDVMDPGSAGWRERAPARLQIARPRKMPPTVLSPQVKIAASYTHAAVAKQSARADGFHDVLFLDDDGNLAESSTMSFFVVSEGAIHTATLDTVLAGVTRRAVIDLVRDEDLPFAEGRLPGDALVRADEAFLTGTTTNVWPVAVVDSRELPAPVPGPVTARLMERFERMVSGADNVFSPRWMQEV